MDSTTTNALQVLALIQKPDIPVAQGQRKPLLRPEVFCPEIHGQSGLAGVDLPVPSRKALLPGKAIEAMYHAIARAHVWLHVSLTFAPSILCLLSLWCFLCFFAEA